MAILNLTEEQYKKLSGRKRVSAKPRKVARKPKPVVQTMSEAVIRKQMESLLRGFGYEIIQHTVGGRMDEYEYKTGARKGMIKKRYTQFLEGGASDIFAIEPRTGRFVAIEVKKPNTLDTVTPEQQFFIDRMNRVGAIAFVATSVDEVAQQLGIKL